MVKQLTDDELFKLKDNSLYDLRNAYFENDDEKEKEIWFNLCEKKAWFILGQVWAIVYEKCKYSNKLKVYNIELLGPLEPPKKYKIYDHNTFEHIFVKCCEVYGLCHENINLIQDKYVIASSYMNMLSPLYKLSTDEAKHYFEVGQICYNENIR